MRIWLDIENPPQVQYLAPFKAAFERLGHEVVVTARNNSITLDLLRERDIRVRVVGTPRKSGRTPKALRVLRRAATLTRIFARQRPDLLVATSRAAALSAWALRVPSFTFCDYEHVDFRVVRLTRAHTFHPDVIDRQAFTSRGLRAEQLLPFHGLKEEISFSGTDIEGTTPWPLPGAPPRPVARVLFRPPGEETHYYVEESGALARELLEWLAARDDAVVVYAPRYPYQEEYLDAHPWRHAPIVLREGAPFLPLLKAVDVVVSSGGTMLREAAYLGIPAYSIFRSAIGQVDRHLEAIGRLTILESSEAFGAIRLGPTTLAPLRRNDDLTSDLARAMIEIVARGR